MCREVTSYDDFRREGFGGGFGTARVVDKCFAVSELLEDLEVHVPGLSASNGPLPFDYKHWNPGDTALTGSFNLVFDRLDIFVGVEVCGGLILTHQARRLSDLTENLDIRNVLVINDEGVEKVG